MLIEIEGHQLPFLSQVRVGGSHTEVFHLDCLSTPGSDLAIVRLINVKAQLSESISCIYFIPSQEPTPGRSSAVKVPGPSISFGEQHGQGRTHLDFLLLAITSPAPLTDTPKNSTVIQCEECLLLGNGMTTLCPTPGYSKYLAFHSADSGRNSVKRGYIGVTKGGTRL